MQDIKPPPFPTETATLRTMLSCLQQLRVWLEDHREWVYTVLNGRSLPQFMPKVLPPVLPIEAYQLVAIQDIGQTWIALRQLRVHWDRLQQRCEDDWHSPWAVGLRMYLIRFGFEMLKQAFVPPERREVIREKEVRLLWEQICRESPQLASMGEHMNFYLDGFRVADLNVNEDLYDRIFDPKMLEEQEEEEDDDE